VPLKKKISKMVKGAGGDSNWTRWLVVLSNKWILTFIIQTHPANSVQH